MIHIIDDQGDSQLKKKVPNDLAAIVAILNPFAVDLAGLIVKPTYNWYWLVDGLMEARFKAYLAKTAAIQRYSGLKYGADDSDENWLANMLRLSFLPTEYIYPKEQRMKRGLLPIRICFAGLTGNF